MTDVNPQVREFNWGKAELVHYKSADGVPLSRRAHQAGELRPDEEVPDDGVHLRAAVAGPAHVPAADAPGTSINPTYYASNGYLVLMPDIAYTVGSPGQSALKCVLPAIQAVVDKGFVDEKAIGIQGHSWGGYQIAYMVTQTNRFKAAVAGRAGVEHDQRLRRHPLGHRAAAAVPVRADAEPHRRDAVGGPDEVHRELADLHGRPRARRRC